jgi:glycosyltransferase involved in cell wall biosynthesis
MIDSLQNGGTERQLCELMSHLDRAKFNPYVCTLKESGKAIPEVDVPVLELDYKSFLSPSIFPLLRRIIVFIRQNEIDIIQTFFQDPFLVAALTKPFHKAKLVGSFRDLGFWRNRVETFKMRLAYPFFSSFIANSEAVKRHFSKVDSIPSDKISVIYNGIDLERVPDPIEASPADSFVVGVVANCNREVKRIDDFIKAAAFIKKEEPGAQFVVVGDGRLRPDLEKLSVNLGINESVNFVGRVSNPLDFISRFHVGVICSESEGFCNAIIEYMACGVPVVATSVGGNTEIVKNDVNGYLSNFGDIESISSSVLLILRNRLLRDRLSIECRKLINEKYSLDCMVSSYQNYYSII